MIEGADFSFFFFLSWYFGKEFWNFGLFIDSDMIDGAVDTFGVWNVCQEGVLDRILW